MFFLVLIEKENLCLYGLPNETWEVNLPVEEVPPELPEPALGINFARDGMQEKDWLSLVAVHSDSWLLAVAFYFGARFGFGKNERYGLVFSVYGHIKHLIFHCSNSNCMLSLAYQNFLVDHDVNLSKFSFSFVLFLCTCVSLLLDSLLYVYITFNWGKKKSSTSHRKLYMSYSTLLLVNFFDRFQSFPRKISVSFALQDCGDPKLFTWKIKFLTLR